MVTGATRPEEVIRQFSDLLDAQDIAYMVTGSIAGSLYGLPRATQDIDVVVSASLEALLGLVRSLPADRYYVSEVAARRAHRDQSLFNVIDLESGWKVDLICRKSRLFSVTEFDRRKPRDVGDSSAYVASAEDVVISKLEWSKRGGSERQLEDVASILQIQADELDAVYIERWVSELGLEEPWSRVRQLSNTSGRNPAC